MEAGEISVTQPGQVYLPIKEAESQTPYAERILAWRDTNGVLTVKFFTEGSFPVMHSGFIYRSSGVMMEYEYRLPESYGVKSNWFGWSF